MPTYLIVSLTIGSGIGIATSANSLALNTYFKEKRRIATGFAWTMTAFGPIIMPHLITFLMEIYDVQGTLLLFSGIALNAVVCAMIFQPVQWHTKKQTAKVVDEIKEPEYECHYCESMKRKNRSIFSSQYLSNADSQMGTGYEIIDPGTPMLSRANDGWFSASGKRSLNGSKMSLTSSRTPRYDSKKASVQNLVMSNRPSYVNLGTLEGGRREKIKEKSTTIKIDADGDYPRKGSLPTTPVISLSARPSYGNLGVLVQEGGRRDKIKEKSAAIKIVEVPAEDCPSYKAPQDLSEVEKTVLIETESPTPVLQKNFYKNPETKRSKPFNLEKEVLTVASRKLQKYIEDDKEKRKKDLYCTCEEERLLFLQQKDYERQEKENRILDGDKTVDNGNNDGVGGGDEDDGDDDDDKYTLWQKITIFFDLDLLKDFSYVNQMIGITIANFAELNFSILTPFVLSDFGLTTVQIARAMSLLGSLDIGVRFFIPFIAGRIGWENRTFFLFGVLGMALGRIGK